MTDSTCPKCGSSYLHSESEGSYFCLDCAHSWYYVASRQQHDKPASPKRVRNYDFQNECECCGHVFTASRYDARFCSPQCRLKAHRDSKKTPQYLLRDRPDTLARYHLLKDISPASADTVARYLRNQSVGSGLEVMTACIAAVCASNEQYRQAFVAITKEYQAARNGLVKHEGAA